MRPPGDRAGRAPIEHECASFASGWFTRRPNPFVRRQAKGCAMDGSTTDRLQILRRRLLRATCLGALACAAIAPPVAAQQNVTLPELNVTASRIGTTGFGAPGTGPSIGIVGTSTSVITAEEIERSPAQTLPEILAREPGVQIQSLFGGTNGARSVVDIRGFGASAP